MECTPESGRCHSVCTLWMTLSLASPPPPFMRLPLFSVGQLTASISLYTHSILLVCSTGGFTRDQSRIIWIPFPGISKNNKNVPSLHSFLQLIQPQLARDTTCLQSVSVKIFFFCLTLRIVVNVLANSSDTLSGIKSGLDYRFIQGLFSCYHALMQYAGGYIEMSSILARPQPMCTTVQRSPNKLWRSNSLFNLW